MDRLEKEAKSASNAKSHLGSGPFPMGVGLGSSARTKKWAPWKDLGFGGKLVRTTAQTGNLTVVLFGGALFLLLTWSLTTELFSRDSPTVLLNEAMDLIDDSEVIDLHLLRPFTFTHLPSASSSRRSSPVQSQVMRNPETGNEHLVMRFWIHGRGIDEQDTTGWWKARWRESKIWIKEAIRDMGADSPEAAAKSQGIEEAPKDSKTQPQGQGWIASIFGALKPSLPRQPISSLMKKTLPPPGTFKSGEGHVDFYRDPETGGYKMLTCTIDVPSGGRRSKQRAVIHWSDVTEVAREGILEGKNYRITF